MKNKGIYYAIEFFILIVLVFFLSNKLLYIENKSKIETKKVTNEFLIRQKDFYTKIEEVNENEYKENKIEKENDVKEEKVEEKVVNETKEIAEKVEPEKPLTNVKQVDNKKTDKNKKEKTDKNKKEKTEKKAKTSEKPNTKNKVKVVKQEEPKKNNKEKKAKENLVDSLIKESLNNETKSK